MLENLKRLFQTDVFKNFAKLLSGTTLAQAIAFLIYPLVTRLYLPEEVGIFGTYMALAGAIGAIATAKYEQAIMLPAKTKDGFHVLLISLFSTLTISFLLFLIIVLFFPFLAGIKIIYDLNTWTYLLPVSVLLAGFMKSFIMWANRRKYFWDIASNNIFQTSLNAAFRLGFGFAGFSTGGLIGGTLIGNGLTSAILSVKMLTKDHLKRFPVSIKKLKYWAIHYINFPKFELLHSLVNNLSGNLPVLFFSTYFSAESAGFYFLGFNVVFRPLSLISASIEQVLSQRIISKYNESKPFTGEIYSILKGLFLMAILPFILFALFTPAIFSIAFGEEWTEAGRYVQILLPWLFMVLLAGPFSFIPSVFYKQRKAMLIEIIYFIMRILALIIGIVNKDLYLALLLFGITGFVILSYKLFWYLSLIHKNTVRE
ncbi:MAG: oligosaccharide flippase family protein [Bacteroidales bacterium]|nr:oligosaccharide flippase family protein [Bacteroidales bacterium]